MIEISTAGSRLRESGPWASGDCNLPACQSFDRQMEASGSTPRVPDLRLRAHSWLGIVVSALDTRLRRRQGVIEYSDRTDCAFRLQLARNPTARMLSDGTRLRVGDRTIVLHMWNEQFPKMPASGPTMGWARQVMDCMDVSLHELARHLGLRPQLDDVQAIRAETHPANPREHRQYARIMAHFGFETFSSPDPRSPAEWARRLGENILISMFILARNPAAFRVDSLRSRRAVSFLSRKLLEQRYGAGDARESRRP